MSLLILFFAIFATIIPIIGSIIIIIAIILLNNYYRPIRSSTLTTISLPKFIREKIEKVSTIDERKIREILTTEQASIADKITALTTININNSALSNIINYQLLSESNDEIRLLAYSLLTQQEDRINNKIKELLTRLKIKTDDLITAKIHKNLALLYWQLINDHLVRDDFLDFITQMALKYAILALKKLSEDGVTWELLGKIYLLKNETYKAYDALNRATRLNVPARKILPYLAELSFKNKNYEEMKNYLYMSNNLEIIPDLAAIINFWDNNR